MDDQELPVNIKRGLTRHPLEVSAARQPRTGADIDPLKVQEDDMCPNCVTPWKCNGPHLPVKHLLNWEEYDCDGRKCECHDPYTCAECGCMHNEMDPITEDSIRREFLDELIAAGAVATPMSYDELNAALDRFVRRYSRIASRMR